MLSTSGTNLWEVRKLGEIVSIKYGKTLPAAQFTGSGFPVYGANGVIGSYHTCLYDEPQVLISCRGANSGTINMSPRQCFITNNSLILEPKADYQLSKRYLYYALKSADKTKLLTGSAQPQVTINNAEILEVPLAPFAEQERIVAKIEELFSELDKGIENLKLAQAQLAVYRQALLKHAFEGKLTNEGANDGNEIPQTWAWQRLGQIASVSGGLTKNPKRELLPRKMKYLRVANVYTDRLELDDVREIGVSDDEAQHLSLQKGDLLVVEGNGSIEQIGRVAEWTGAIPDCGHQNHLIRARLSKAVQPRFALRFLQSPSGRDAIIKAASSTSGLHTLSISKVANLRIPVAPVVEQQTLLDVVEPALDNVLALESDIATNLAKSEALRQSILKKAFAGELVAQDPSDEPASELLARIRAERNVTPNGKSTSRRQGKNQTNLATGGP